MEEETKIHAFKQQDDEYGKLTFKEQVAILLILVFGLLALFFIININDPTCKDRVDTGAGYFCLDEVNYVLCQLGFAEECKKSFKDLICVGDQCGQVGIIIGRK